jgi:glycerol uptake facilitator-like aquaporin
MSSATLAQKLVAEVVGTAILVFAVFRAAVDGRARLASPGLSSASSSTA